MQGRGRFVGIALLGVLAVSGCSDDGSSGDDGNGGTGGNGGNGAGNSIHITFDGDDVTPNGKQVEVSADEPVILHITADQPGEIHVHSTPEQEIEYDAGESTHELTPLDRPGVYEVESHDLGKIIVELEAS